MREPKIGDRVRIHEVFKDDSFIYDSYIYELQGKVCVCLKDTSDGYVDISEASLYRLRPEDYTLVVFGDYLSEIERGENDESDSLSQTNRATC